MQSYTVSNLVVVLVATTISLTIHFNDFFVDLSQKNSKIAYIYFYFFFAGIIDAVKCKHIRLMAIAFISLLLRSSTLVLVCLLA